MIVLYILIGIVILFALILNIRAHIHVEYEKELTAYAKWAFLKIPLIPFPEKQEKPKKEEPVKKEEPPAEEKPAETPKPKGPNPLMTIYENEQIQGILEILRTLLEIVGKLGRRFVNSFVIDELFLDIDVTKKDAAETAEEYGKMCRVVFPVTGAVCANCNVKKYSINVEPDYIANPGIKTAFSMEISLNPRKLINAVLAFAFSAVFRIGIRLIKDLKPKTPENATQQKTQATEETTTNETITNDENKSESGAQ